MLKWSANTGQSLLSCLALPHDTTNITKPSLEPLACLLTCTARAGGPLRASVGAHVPVQRGLWRGQHPAVAQGGGGRCQGLAAQSPSWLVHGVGIGHRHRHMHGEVLLRQCCGLQEGRQTHADIYTHTQAHSKSKV